MQVEEQEEKHILDWRGTLNTEKTKVMAFASKVNGKHARHALVPLLLFIAKIRSFVLFQDAQSLNHAFISTRLDYCGSFFLGLLQRSIDRLQLIESIAETVLTKM